MSNLTRIVNISNGEGFFQHPLAGDKVFKGADMTFWFVENFRLKGYVATK